MKKEYFERCEYDIKYESFDGMHLCSATECVYKENYKTKEGGCMKGGLISILEENATKDSPYIESYK